MKGVFAALAGSFWMVMLGGCGTGDRPRASSDVVDEEKAMAALLPAPPPPEPTPICLPGADRACIATYKEDGRKNCFPSTQFSRADGFGWLACGEPPEPAPAAEPESDPEQAIETEVEDPDVR